MDPLSVTASFIAVLQVANAVISICYDYSASAKSSSRELSRIIEEIKALRNVLESLIHLAERAETPDLCIQSRLPTLRGLCEPEMGPLSQCLEEMRALEKKLVPPTWGGPIGSKRRALIQALGWPLKEKDTLRTLEKIGRFKATLCLGIMADQSSLTLEIKDTTLSLRQECAKSRIDDQRERIQRWLSAPDPSMNHNEARKRWQATTGSWFTNSSEFRDWKTKQNSMLWLHGIPGCGKSVLSSTIIEDVLDHCKNNKSASAVAYFYFDFNDMKKQRHEHMIRSLITQLAVQFASTPAALELLFSSCMDGERQPTVQALLIALKEIIQDFEDAYIVIDALDECKDRHELLQSIEEVSEWRLEELHILVTSRREKDLEEAIESVDNQGQISIQSELVNDDIRVYVHERLQKDRKLKRWQNHLEVQSEIEMTLTNKADGMFRWVVCQLDALGDCLNLPTLRKALSSLPRTLDDTYTRILDNIHEDYTKDALKILQWLAYAARPLRIDELVEVIAIDVDGNPRFDPERRLPDPQDILTICSGLVTTVTEVIENNDHGFKSIYVNNAFETNHGESVETTETQIRLAHFSVKEYLVSKRIQSGRAVKYSIRELDANASIAQDCLAYLLQFDTFGNLNAQTIGLFPLARYAAKYWTQHVRVAEQDSATINSMIMELFMAKRDAFANWIWIFDMDYRMHERKDKNILLDPKSTGSPLYYASLAGLAQSVRLLLKEGAEPNAVGGRHGTALYAASLNGYDEIVEQLLAAGADIHYKTGDYGSALAAATTAGDDRIVQLLLNAGADANVQGGCLGSALTTALFYGHDRIAQQLLDAGADGTPHIKDLR